MLTSPETFSAGETLGLAMGERPNLQIAGLPTTGHFSDVHDSDPLPNGWSDGFSGELYTAADGKTYEGSSVPIDREVEFDADAFEEGRDNQLEEALRILRG